MLLVCPFTILFFYSCNQNKKITKENPAIINGFQPWEKGFFDIHHINTGGGDATFFILPDGTTMLFDAGRLDKDAFEEKYAPLKAISQKPNDSLSVAQWLGIYIKNIIPKSKDQKIDYALISHFHEDHYGSLVELGRVMPFRKIIDRNYPDYNFPFDLKEYLSKDDAFMEYLTYIEENKILAEALKTGSDSQIKLLKEGAKYPSFKIQNVKSNGTIWTGKGNEAFEYFIAEDMISFYKGKYNENPLSLALKISYGDFDYFTGGDNTGLQGFGLPEWFDVETPIAKAVGKVEVTTLNHHGNRDATNEFFVNSLDPKVVIQQSWCSDHPGQEVYQRLIYKDNNAEKRDIFATDMHDETIVTYGPWFKENYKSMHGHIVVRVYPNGKKYEVIILNDESIKLTVKQRFGPYYSK
ncbi:ComEC/Rec2 family competence protein [Flavivirga spongiicola]|uniref:MBL fold metallo-hydrolase n=1 Tax=Flavivirga spongiicola TaxID=421621 RepID=A0ABU7XPU1_9FLAO|nr:MBL fold metallo-hydrolase [Flavivirga sp. MEBiC05379]MDO5977463.1 MBL fold metallo-hydrolase [Flavivirga sp. MEBiC05379]